MGLPDRHPLTVFLSAGATTDTTLARRLLSRAADVIVSWDELPGDSAQRLPGIPDSVDALIAVIDRRSMPTGVLLELGAALGRGLPAIILLANAELLNALPPSLRELPIVVATEAGDAVAQRLSDTIRSAVDAARASYVPEPPRTTKTYLKEVRERDWADESERRVATIFAGLGARVVGQEPANTSSQVDLAAWIPGLPSPHLNPVLIEVTGRRPSIRAKEQQLLGFLHDRGAQLGVLVIPEGDTLRWNVAEGKAIIVISIDRLSQLTADSLMRLLMDGRNKLAHAAP